MTELRICIKCHESEAQNPCFNCWSERYLAETGIPQQYVHSRCPEEDRMAAAEDRQRPPEGPPSITFATTSDASTSLVGNWTIPFIRRA